MRIKNYIVTVHGITHFDWSNIESYPTYTVGGITMADTNAMIGKGYPEVTDYYHTQRLARKRLLQNTLVMLGATDPEDGMYYDEDAVVKAPRRIKKLFRRSKLNSITEGQWKKFLFLPERHYIEEVK